MPPIIAFIICTTFVFWLLCLERKQSPDMSFALWLPTIFILVTFSKPLAIWFNAGGSDMEAGSPLDRAFLIGLGFLGLIIIIKRHCSFSYLIKDNIWILIFTIYTLISISWSETPFVSFKRWTREIVTIIMVFLVATEKDPHQSIQSIFRRLIYILIPFSLLLIKYYTDLGVNYSNTGVQMWTGVGLHKNTLSCLCTFCIVFMIWTFIRKQRGHDKIVVWYQTYVEVFLLSLTIYLFMGPNHTPTNSATSLIALTLALSALFGSIWMQKHGKLISANVWTLVIVLIIVYGSITPFLGGLTVIDVSNVVGREESLTGRSDIWRSLIPFVMNKPFLGYGFGGFWTSAMRDKLMAPHGHNGYLDIILNIGVIGLVIFSILLIKNCRNAHKKMTNNFEWGILWLCFLLITVLNNMTESSAIFLHSSNMIVLLFLSIPTVTGIVNNK